MAGFLNRRTLFGTLIAAAVALVLLDRFSQLNLNVFAGFWSELFWLIIGIVVISFVLETLLAHDLERQRREDVEFAFRTFTGAVLDDLLEMVRTRNPRPPSPMAAALQDLTRFAISAKEVAAHVGTAEGLNLDSYLQRSQNVGSGLRELAVGYVRIFSSTEANQSAPRKEGCH
ncbi:hypothetical protein [Vitiosangium sp. GDMCC 1.1324]|uniref:hypothetical protein n=1 Tax=Vitiosangium sp. (strain GDMCC 1.1324) TaxID=2138576 RepID=UPI000D3438A6|nr:hypothetical protein [Vitiosangium sp. GDMCC 1.1324]PTL75546.1 hypothetical protein DAT35_53975 [Vitiosangium sp. GDMCC 1.1324]